MITRNFNYNLTRFSRNSANINNTLLISDKL